MKRRNIDDERTLGDDRNLVMIQEIADYRIEKSLGHSRQGGRATYLAEASDKKVVLKEFRFQVDEPSGWEQHKQVQREVEILKSLDHPRIPKFLDSFETKQGICLVQEYIDAPNLEQKRTYTFEQIKKIASDLLEILVYLQSLNPPVLHRDIKPGNLLLDGEDNLYLVDFGFSRIGLRDLASSSIVMGTTGFMPPEQLLGRDLTMGSDLYSVGATLVCLIAGIPSGRLAEHVDLSSNRLDLNELLSNIEPNFKRWIQRLMEPRPSDRFASAQEALEGLWTSSFCARNNMSYADFEEKRLQVLLSEKAKNRQLMVDEVTATLSSDNSISWLAPSHLYAGFVLFTLLVCKFILFMGSTINSSLDTPILKQPSPCQSTITQLNCKP